MEIYKIGSRGAMVKQIQQALAGAGLAVIPDGIYGRITLEAVTEFQRMNGLKVDGMVGPATLAKLIPCRLRKSKRRITEIIVHCSDTPAGREVTVEDIRRWHKEKGWSDIGYHYVVYLDGSVHEGRSVDIIGAHCEGHNAHSIGVCYVGGKSGDSNLAKDTRTDRQKAALLSLMLDLRKMYPDAKIYGHRDFAAKDCPCFNAKYEYRYV